MSFFKKKKPEPTQREVLENFERRISDAEALTDPGSRYLELAGIQQDIVKVFNDNMYSDSKDATKNLKEGGMIVGVSAAVGALVFPFVPPVGIAVASIGGGLGGLCASANAAILLRNKKNVRETGVEYLPALRDLYKKISSKQEEIVEKHIIDVGTSPRFKEICTTFPDVAVAFAQAAVKTGLDIPRVVQLNKTTSLKKEP